MSKSSPSPLSRGGKLLIAMVIIAAAGAVIWSQLPRGGYSTDLSVIGQGRPALVLAYDQVYVGGTEVMDHMNRVRASYADRMEFVVADMGTAEGRNFVQRHEVRDGAVLLFDADGVRQGTINQPRSPEELQRAIDGALSGSMPGR
ncbi:MAG: hypothetical protein WED00_08060 [Aquisalimonadaceae bacterium]